MSRATYRHGETVDFCLVSYMHAQHVQTRLVNHHRIGLLQRLHEVVAKILGQGDGTRDRVNDDDLHARRFRQLSFFRKIGPEAEVEI